MKDAGVILAGGRSSRMGGGEKALLDLGGKSLLQHAIDRLAPQVERLAISANREIKAYERYGFPVLRDAMPNYPGPLAGIYSAMIWARGEGHSHVVTAAGDTPFFPLTLAGDFAASGAQIAMAVTPDPARGIGRHPVFARWDVSLVQALGAALEEGTRKIVAWTDQFGTVQVSYDTKPFDPFFNVNTPDDLQKALEIVRGQGRLT